MKSASRLLNEGQTALAHTVEKAAALAVFTRLTL